MKKETDSQKEKEREISEIVDVRMTSRLLSDLCDKQARESE